MKAIIVLILTSIMCGETVADTAKLEALVLDEISGEPIEGALVRGGFEIEVPSWERVKGSPRPNEDFKLTDKHGRCKLQGKTNNGGAGVAVRDAAGYYRPVRGAGCSFKSKNFFGVWQPDNLVVTIKLQRVEHPVPLWVKNVGDNVFDTCREDIFAKGNGRIEFDFLVGDWLPPVGKGKVADVEFVRLPHEDLGAGEVDGIKGKAYRDSMSVKFLGTDNGLLEMHPDPVQALKIRKAPGRGYNSEYLSWKGIGKGLQRETNYNSDRCFCFRIRTRLDEQGNVVEAYYGKIYGDFKIAYKSNPYVPVASVQMLYYLNPTSLDRNLEWDRKTNLCPNPGDVGHSVGDRRP